MTKQEFRDTLKEYSDLYGEKLEKEMLDAWWNKFGRANIAALEYALHYACQDAYKFPSFGQVLKHFDWNRIGWSGGK